MHYAKDDIVLVRAGQHANQHGKVTYVEDKDENLGGTVHFNLIGTKHKIQVKLHCMLLTLKQSQSYQEMRSLEDLYNKYIDEVEYK